MHLLDNLQFIKKLDQKNMLTSIEMLGEQINQAWQESQGIKIPKSFRKINKIVINGMGGSGLGGHIIESLYFKDLKIPFGVIHSYDLPGIVDQNTLYIISSYSGDTEEPISTLKEAKKRKIKILAITTGGRLGKLVKKYKIPAYIINEKFNPCGEPRMGIGYSVAGIFVMLKKCGIIKVSNQEIKEVVLNLNQYNKKFGVRSNLKNNLVKQLAKDLQNKISIIVSSEFLTGNAHTIANQINENSKNFSDYFIISELNHHLLEGLAYPRINRNILKFLFIESKFYLPKNQLRYKITQQVLKKNKIDFIKYKVQSKTKLEQVFEVLLMGSYLSFYLACLNKTNPSPIPWVDYFKRELKKK